MVLLQGSPESRNNENEDAQNNCKQKIGLCAGVFDMLHKGHTNFLKNARKHCDYLIVTVASDWITRVQKGQNRPYWGERKRLLDIKQSGLADEIILTDLIDVTELLYIHNVDILIRGEEQLNLKPYEWDEVAYIPYTKGISTTRLISEK